MRQRDTPDDIAEMVTVAEAAETLGVSASTIWRWIDAGRLHAFRIGPKMIRIRKGDLASTVHPAELAGTPKRWTTDLTPRRLTPEEVRRGLAALEAAEQLRAAIRRRRHGRPLPDSTPLIRAERERRSRL